MPAHPADVVVLWHLSASTAADASVRAAAVALVAPDAIGSLERALRAHPRAHFSLAIDAGALEGLARAAAGDSALQTMASGHLVGGARSDMLRVLAQVPVLDASLATTPAARRYRALATAVPYALAPQKMTSFSVADAWDFAGFAALVRLAAAGELPLTSPDLQKSRLSSAEASAAVGALGTADHKTLDGLKELVAAGQLEVLADPAGEPILPLLVDSSGKSGANVVKLDAAADAALLVDLALHALTVNGLAPSAPAGVYSPHGAYDDNTAALLEQHHASFALFSDRVLRSSPIGSSRDAVAAADAAAFHSYAVRAAAGPALPVFFWSQDEGSALSVLSPRLPAGAMAGRVLELAGIAGARAGEHSIIVLRIEADGLWNRRADRARVVDLLAAGLASGKAGSVTVGQYVRARAPSLTSYGFAPAADEGALTFWMGTFNQAKMWTALADARRAAGGDAALQRDATRSALFDAEASHWYAVPNLIAPPGDIDRLMDGFRQAIVRIYQSAGKATPPNIAPLSPQAPISSPKPSS